MSDDATPDKVRLTDWLGPLPEPDVWRARGTLWSLPTLMKLRLQDEAEGLFAAEKMHAYAAAAAAAERERIGAALLKMHERDGVRHNYWLCAWRELFGA